MYNQELYKLFDFNESELAANRVGRLSEKQARRLKDSEASANGFFIKLGIFLILLGFFISYQILRSALPGGFSLEAIFAQSTKELLQMALMLLFPWAILGIFIYFSFWMASTKIDNTLEHVEGRVNFVKVEKQESYKTASGSTSQRAVQQYELRVGDVKFHDVPEEYLNIMEEGDIYAFHFTKQTREILSAEILSKGK